MKKIYVRENGSENLLLPANEGDQGFDLIAASEPKIVGKTLYSGEARDRIKAKFGVEIYESIDYIEYDTEVAIQPTKSSELSAYVFPRSSLRDKKLVLCNSVGVIDTEYRGNLKVSFKYIPAGRDTLLCDTKVEKPDGLEHLVVTNCAVGYVVDLTKIYQKGDKIAQVVFLPTAKVSVEKIQELDETKRGDNGHGSTGN